MLVSANPDTKPGLGPVIPCHSDSLMIGEGMKTEKLRPA